MEMSTSTSSSEELDTFEVLEISKTKDYILNKVDQIVKAVKSDLFYITNHQINEIYTTNVADITEEQSEFASTSRASSFSGGTFEGDFNKVIDCGSPATDTEERAEIFSKNTDTCDNFNTKTFDVELGSVQSGISKVLISTDKNMNEYCFPIKHHSEETSTNPMHTKYIPSSSMEQSNIISLDNSDEPVPQCSSGTLEEIRFHQSKSVGTKRPAEETAGEKSTRLNKKCKIDIVNNIDIWHKSSIMDNKKARKHFKGSSDISVRYDSVVVILDTKKPGNPDKYPIKKPDYGWPQESLPKRGLVINLAFNNDSKQTRKISTINSYVDDFIELNDTTLIQELNKEYKKIVNQCSFFNSPNRVIVLQDNLNLSENECGGYWDNAEHRLKTELKQELNRSLENFQIPKYEKTSPLKQHQWSTTDHLCSTTNNKDIQDRLFSEIAPLQTTPTTLLSISKNYNCDKEYFPQNNSNKPDFLAFSEKSDKNTLSSRLHFDFEKRNEHVSGTCSFFSTSDMVASSTPYVSKCSGALITNLESENLSTPLETDGLKEFSQIIKPSNIELVGSIIPDISESTVVSNSEILNFENRCDVEDKASQGNEGLPFNSTNIKNDEDCSCDSNSNETVHLSDCEGFKVINCVNSIINSSNSSNSRDLKFPVGNTDCSHENTNSNPVPEISVKNACPSVQRDKVPDNNFYNKDAPLRDNKEDNNKYQNESVLNISESTTTSTIFNCFLNEKNETVEICDKDEIVAPSLSDQTDKYVDEVVYISDSSTTSIAEFEALKNEKDAKSFSDIQDKVVDIVLLLDDQNGSTNMTSTNTKNTPVLGDDKGNHAKHQKETDLQISDDTTTSSITSAPSTSFNCFLNETVEIYDKDETVNGQIDNYTDEVVCISDSSTVSIVEFDNLKKENDTKSFSNILLLDGQNTNDTPLPCDNIFYRIENTKNSIINDSNEDNIYSQEIMLNTSTVESGKKRSFEHDDNANNCCDIESYIKPAIIKHFKEENITKTSDKDNETDTNSTKNINSNNPLICLNIDKNKLYLPNTTVENFKYSLDAHGVTDTFNTDPNSLFLENSVSAIENFDDMLLSINPQSSPTVAVIGEENSTTHKTVSSVVESKCLNKPSGISPTSERVEIIKENSYVSPNVISSVVQPNFVVSPNCSGKEKPCTKENTASSVVASNVLNKQVVVSPKSSLKTEECKSNVVIENTLSSVTTSGISPNLSSLNQTVDISDMVTVSSTDIDKSGSSKTTEPHIVPTNGLQKVETTLSTPKEKLKLPRVNSEIGGRPSLRSGTIYTSSLTNAPVPQIYVPSVYTNFNDNATSRGIERLSNSKNCTVTSINSTKASDPPFIASNKINTASKTTAAKRPAPKTDRNTRPTKKRKTSTNQNRPYTSRSVGLGASDGIDANEIADNNDPRWKLYNFSEPQDCFLAVHNQWCMQMPNPHEDLTRRFYTKKPQLKIPHYELPGDRINANINCLSIYEEQLTDVCNEMRNLKYELDMSGQLWDRRRISQIIARLDKLYGIHHNLCKAWDDAERFYSYYKDPRTGQDVRYITPYNKNEVKYVLEMLDMYEDFYGCHD